MSGRFLGSGDFRFRLVVVNWSQPDRSVRVGVNRGHFWWQLVSITDYREV
jgi:hypothetical protein